MPIRTKISYGGYTGSYQRLFPRLQCRTTAVVKSTKSKLERFESPHVAGFHEEQLEQRAVVSSRTQSWYGFPTLPGNSTSTATAVVTESTAGAEHKRCFPGERDGCQNAAREPPKPLNAAYMCSLASRVEGSTEPCISIALGSVAKSVAFGWRIFSCLKFWLRQNNFCSKKAESFTVLL